MHGLPQAELSKKKSSSWWCRMWQIDAIFQGEVRSYRDLSVRVEGLAYQWLRANKNRRWLGGMALCHVPPDAPPPIARVRTAAARRRRRKFVCLISPVVGGNRKFAVMVGGWLSARRRQRKFVR